MTTVVLLFLLSASPSPLPDYHLTNGRLVRQPKSCLLLEAVSSCGSRRHPKLPFWPRSCRAGLALVKLRRRLARQSCDILRPHFSRASSDLLFLSRSAVCLLLHWVAACGGGELAATSSITKRRATVRPSRCRYLFTSPFFALVIVRVLDSETRRQRQDTKTGQQAPSGT